MVQENLFRIFEKLKMLVELPRLYLSNYFSDIRTEIDLAFFEKELGIIDNENKMKLRHNWQEMINKVNSFEEECLIERSIKKFKEISYDSKPIVDSIEEKYDLALKTNNDYELKHLEELAYDEMCRIEKKLFQNKTIIFLDRSKSNKSKLFLDYLSLFAKLDNKATVGKLLIISNYCFGEKEICVIKNKSEKFVQRLSNETILCNNLVTEMINSPTDLQFEEKNVNVNNLTEVVLCENYLTLIYSNRNLHIINLNSSSNKIKPDLFHGLKRLKSLYIYKAFKDFDQFDPQMLKELDDLKLLHIYENPLSSLDTCNLFSKLQNLKEIKLCSNKLKSIDSHIFSGLVNLVTIDLSRNKIKSLYAKQFAGLTNLKTIILSRNKLESIPIDLFKGLINLTHIYLNNNFLRNLTYESFDELTNLQEINIYNNPLVIDSNHLKLKKSVKLILNF